MLVNKSPSERHFDYLNNTYSSETLNETLALLQSLAAEPVAANGTPAAGSEIDLSGERRNCDAVADAAWE